jgi:hypothetical protein
MRGPRSLLPWLAAAALVCGAANARADPRDDSRAAFRRGVALAQQGDYRRARDAFLEAYKLFAHPSILLNLGIARWKTGELVLAEQDLAKFLADDGGASQDDVASARAAISAVRLRLGTVRVHVSPSFGRATLDGQALPLVLGELAEVRAVVGEHVLEAQADGFSPKRFRILVDAGRATSVDVSLEPEKSAPGSAPGPVAPPRREAAGMSTRRVVGWVLVGAGGGAALVGLLAGLRAQALAREYNSQPAGAQDPKTRSDGIFLRTTADVAFLTALVSGGVGAYLLLAPEPSRGVIVSPGLIGVFGSF